MQSNAQNASRDGGTWHFTGDSSPFLSGLNFAHSADIILTLNSKMGAKWRVSVTVVTALPRFKIALFIGLINAKAFIEVIFV